MLRIAMVIAVACAAWGCGSSPDVPGPFDEVPLDETLRVEGLEAPVEIVRDEFGVPHIYARDMRDLGFANGYAVASDRIQQMDLFRHVATGQASRLLGSFELDLIDDDLEIRMHRLHHFVLQNYAILSTSMTKSQAAW